MKPGKILSMIILVACILMAVSVAVMHTVEASTSSGRESANSIDDDKSEDGAGSEANDNLENNLVFIVLPIIIVIVVLVGVYLNTQKVEPLGTETRVEPLSEPIYENYDYNSWGSSEGNWSRINDSWDSRVDEPGREYGSMEQQYQTLYSTGEPEY